jgi:hypothetical protein
VLGQCDAEGVLLSPTPERRKPFDVLARGLTGVTQSLPSWNQIRTWIRELDGLRTAMGKTTEGGAEAS